MLWEALTTTDKYEYKMKVTSINDMMIGDVPTSADDDGYKMEETSINAMSKETKRIHKIMFSFLECLCACFSSADMIAVPERGLPERGMW